MWKVNNGEYEAQTLPELISSIVNYHISISDESPSLPDIDNLYYENDWGAISCVCDKAMRDIEIMIHNQIVDGFRRSESEASSWADHIKSLADVSGGSPAW